MRERSVGVKRIVVILSVLSTVVWVTFVLVVSEGFTEMAGGGWIFLLVGIIVAYFVPQLICKAVYWVLDGFEKDKKT